MEFEGKSRRSRERLKLALPVQVRCKETTDFEWVELSRLVDVTPFGARFTLAHLTEPGRLLHLTLPMPRQLRCFDHIEQQYRVYALVRNMSPYKPPPARKGAPVVASSQPEVPRFEVGVAFVGKRAPASYEKDPSTRYEISNLMSNGCLWEVREKGLPAQAAQVARSQDTRLQMPIDVLIEVFDEDGKIIATEQTVTENISRRGAAVWTTLTADRGRFVRMTSLQNQLSVTAAVRARRAGPDGIMRLHLEFIDRLWPLEGVEQESSG
jgi:hypothetical protein